MEKKGTSFLKIEDVSLLQATLLALESNVRPGHENDGTWNVIRGKGK